MDTSTFDLYRVLQSGPYDEAGLNQVKRLLGGERRLLRSKNDLRGLEQLIPMLQDWAAAAGGGWLSASALAEAAEIAEVDLRNSARAEQLRSQAIVSGRATSAPPTPLPDSVAFEGAIDANAELLHELKTLPPGALTQTLVAEPTDADGGEDRETEADAARPSSIPRPRSVPAPWIRSDAGGASRPRTLHGVAAPQLDALEHEPEVKPAPRSTPVPALLAEPLGQSEFPARLRSTPPPALRSVTEPRRPASVPAQPRAAATAAAASQVRRPSVPTQPIRLTPLPQLAAHDEAQEHTQEVHTIDLELQSSLSVPPLADAQEVHTVDLELHSTLSLPPLTAASENDADLSDVIAAAEQALDSDASPDRVRELAELYVKRDAPGDRQQAADLYCTLGEVLGNPAGIAMLDRALVLVPDHSEAKALLTRYAVRPRLPISSPKITVLGMPPKLSMPQPPPPAAAVVPPMAAGAAAPARSVLPPTAAAEPSSAHADARTTLPGSGPLNDVLALHGVPQVVTTRPSVPPISSLTPIVRSDASELQARRLSVVKTGYLALGGLALSAAAALGLYLSTRAPSNHNAAPLARPDSASEQVAAASQPMAKPIEPVILAAVPSAAAGAAAAPEERAQAGKPAPLTPPGPSHLPLLKLESAQLRGGKLSEPQLAAALGKAQPKLLACYEQAIEKKPRIKGRVIYGFTVRTNGRATNIKRVGGTLKDDALLQCSAKVLETVRFPKPRKSSQVKLPISYKRT